MLNNEGWDQTYFPIPRLRSSNNSSGCLFREYMLLDDEPVDHPVQIALQGKTSALAAGEWC